MIVDSSALVAILRHEGDAQHWAERLEAADSVLVSAATVLETSIVVGPQVHAHLDRLLSAGGVEVAPFDEAQARVARQAYVDYGKGSGSKARLNFGDCFSYALAKSTGRPLLFKGDDFTHTDVESAG